ncbi:MAG TPA: peptidoglycan-binding domain-containing protein [Bryobacteraceae bacterium]
MPLRTALRILVLSAAIAALVAAAPEGTTVAQKAAKKPAATKPATQNVAKAKAPPKAKVSGNAVPKSGALKAASQTASKKKSASKTAPPAAAVRRTNQQHPTLDRYKEIQQALADKRYFSGSVDGNWAQDSVDALKRFQHDQNLTEDGKIGSLSLIALGLGPKHDASPIGSAPVLDRPSEKTDP